MDDKGNLDLIDINVGIEEMFKAHPIRAVMTIPFDLWGLKIILELLSTPVRGGVLGEIVIVLIKLSLLSCISWLVYGPINLHNLKKAKQMEKMAEYMVNNTRQAPVNANEEVVEYKYCAFCGKQLNANWKACPYCGKREKL